MKVLTVIGARPQFIKAAVVSAEMRRRKEELKEIVVHTGQHFDQNMSRIFFDQMGMHAPDYHLGIHSLAHGAMTGRMMVKLEEVIERESPGMVMVYGDTNSTLAGALVARKLNIPVAHVEAGLRSFDMTMPEEVNRVLTDRISHLLFCPTQGALENLVKEGFESFPCSMLVTGDVMLDAALKFLPMAVPPAVDLPGEFVLVTVHRQSNTDDPGMLKELIAALSEVASDCHVVIPLHPRTTSVIKKNGLSLSHGNISVIEPVGYLESLWLLNHCRMVLTDSGGLQKEAYFMGKACVTLRKETEWTELVDEGANIPAGVKKEAVMDAYNHLKRTRFSPDLSLYGEGKAASRIVDALLNQYKGD